MILSSQVYGRSSAQTEYVSLGRYRIWKFRLKYLGWEKIKINLEFSEIDNKPGSYTLLKYELTLNKLY